MYACVTAYPYVHYIHVVLSETKKEATNLLELSYWQL